MSAVLRSAQALCVLGIAAIGASGCVLVSTSSTGPRVDAGLDAGIDAQRPDVGPAPDADAGDAGPASDAGAPVCERGAVLESIATRVIVPTYRAFDDRAAALESAAAAYASSLSDADRDAVRAAWHAAMDAWQEAEVMQLGPAGMPPEVEGGVIGGMDLRDEIYSWDYSNRCRVDQETVSGDFEDPDVFATEDVNVRGLDELEYLLFFEGTTNGCTASALINSSGQWAALVAAGEIPARRARYARTLAILVHRTASRLLAAWEPSGGDFGGQLARGDGAYPDMLQALNAVSDALILYADRKVKDMKIAGPAAISMACVRMDTGCPELLESRWSERNRENILANLRAIRAIVLGGPSRAEGAGFDDLLSCADCAGTAERLVAAIDQAIAVMESLPAITAASLERELARMIAAHVAVKTITDILKTELVTCLDLDLPFSGTGSDDAD